jgi:hypothetical protein
MGTRGKAKGLDWEREAHGKTKEWAKQEERERNTLKERDIGQRDKQRQAERYEEIRGTRRNTERQNEKLRQKWRATGQIFPICLSDGKKQRAERESKAQRPP